MGVFDGYTSILFREDASGRRVYAPFGTWGGVYEVPNGEARRIQRQVKIFWAAWLVLVIVLQDTLGWFYTLAAIPLVLAVYFGLAALQVRRLPRLPVSAREVPRVSRGELQTRYSRAIGAPTLAALTAASVVFVMIGVWFLVRGIGGVQIWFVVVFFGFCGVSLFLQWRRARS